MSLINVRKPDYNKAQHEAQKTLDALGYSAPPVSPLDVAAFYGLSVVEVVMPAITKRLQDL